VNLSWGIRDKQLQQCEALTRDISSRGMFVFTRANLRLGMRLRFKINVVPDVPLQVLRVFGEGQVVRVERSAPKTGMTGFPVVSRWFKIRELRSEV
jgi:PilZ domain